MLRAPDTQDRRSSAVPPGKIPAHASILGRFYVHFGASRGAFLVVACSICAAFLLRARHRCLRLVVRRPAPQRCASCLRPLLEEAKPSPGAWPSEGFDVPAILLLGQRADPGCLERSQTPSTFQTWTGTRRPLITRMTIGRPQRQRGEMQIMVCSLLFSCAPTWGRRGTRGTCLRCR